MPKIPSHRYVAAWLVAAFALSAAPPAQADISPEFQQILNDASADFKVNAADMKDCDADALEIARQALNHRFVTNAMAGPVVIGALENSCKAVLDAFGLGYIGSTYSVAKCAFQYLDGTNDTKGFAACLAAEGVSYVMGKAFEELDVNNVAAAGANVTAGKGLDALKDMINTYQSSGSRTEFDTVQYGPAQGFPCNVDVNVQWRKPRNPVRGDGEIFMVINISGCDCSRSNPYGGMTLESGSVRYRIPVKFYNDGGKPAWFVDNARATLEVRSKCCGRAQTTIRTYSHAGTLIRTGTEGGTTAVTPGPVAPPPPPPPPPPLPPPRPQWPDDPARQLAMCPECQPIARDIELTRAGIADVDARIAGIAASLAQNRAAQAPLARRIAQLQAELNSQAGTGGSAVDTTTGVTTSAVTQADGSVLVTTTAPDGTVLEQHSRPRRDLAKVKDEMDGVQKQLDRLKADEAALNRQLDNARARRAGLEADLQRLIGELAACLALCRERLTGAPAFSMETVKPIAGNNPFDPRNPLGSSSTTPSTCPPPQPSPQTQVQSCPAGQTGSITITRPFVCSGTTWVPGQPTTVNTCTSTPTGCTTPQPPAETQTLPCPAGQTGSITQTRTYTCVGTAWIAGPFTTTSNTCTTPPASGCATNFSSGNYSCGGACGIATTSLSVTPGNSTMTANPFGANSNVQFSCSGPTANSASSNLTILGQPGHSCTLNGQSQTAFGIACRNNSGGTCSSSCSR
jgi:hypothetical protein